jgi:hypothetical protein
MKGNVARKGKYDIHTKCYVEHFNRINHLGDLGMSEKIIGVFGFHKR